MKLIRLLLSATLLLSFTAYAGLFKIDPVTIVGDEEAGRASGNLIAARFSENEYERIGCAVAYREDKQFAYCEASLEPGDESGVYCVTEDPVVIDTIASINTFSYVYFAWESGKCTEVTVATRSIHIPAKLKP